MPSAIPRSRRPHRAGLCTGVRHGGRASRGLIQGFLLFTLPVNITGFLFHQNGPQPTPAQLTGVISLAVALFALYGRGLAGPWRWIFVVTAVVAQWPDVFVLVVRSFLKIPALHNLAPGGPVFGAVQGLALIFCRDWLSVSETFQTLIPCRFFQKTCSGAHPRI